MDLDCGVLARLDRKLLAGLDQDATYRMVRVPVTSASGRRGSRTASRPASRWVEP